MLISRFASTYLRGEADLNQLSDQLIKITQDTSP